MIRSSSALGGESETAAFAKRVRAAPQADARPRSKACQPDTEQPLSIVVRLALVSLIPISSMHAETSAQQFVARPSVTLARPAATADIVETAIASKCTTLARALEAAGLVEALKGAGPFTLFAPTDEAFAALPKGTLESLLLPENKDLLVKILTYHVVPGTVMAADVTAGEVATVEGQNITIATDGGVTVNGAAVLQTDIVASNGVIHVIDAVLLPADVDAAALATP